MKTVHAKPVPARLGLAVFLLLATAVVANEARPSTPPVEVPVTEERAGGMLIPQVARLALAAIVGRGTAGH